MRVNCEFQVKIKVFSKNSETVKAETEKQGMFCQKIQNMNDQLQQL